VAWRRLRVRDLLLTMRTKLVRYVYYEYRNVAADLWYDDISDSRQLDNPGNLRDSFRLDHALHFYIIA
jgi:hypothetical protein